MLNVRKLKQDFSQSVLKEGKALFEEKKIFSAKILHLDAATIRISAKVGGQYENSYMAEIEIDRQECETIDSDCDCPYHYDCQHLASLLFYLEEHIDAMIVDFSKDSAFETVTTDNEVDQEQKTELFEAVKEAVSKEEDRKYKEMQKELLDEYMVASKIFSSSPFFLPSTNKTVDLAEIGLLYTILEDKQSQKPIVELQMVLRLKSRSKPLHIPSAKKFIEALRHEESLNIAGKTYLFTLNSFSELEQDIVSILIDHARVYEKASTERGQRCAFMEIRTFSMMLACAYESGVKKYFSKGISAESEVLPIPCIYAGSLENPLQFSTKAAWVHVAIEYIDPPFPKILINPTIDVEMGRVAFEEARILECRNPGVIYEGVYQRFSSNTRRQHLLHIKELREITIPEPLFGTFVENALPEMVNSCKVSNIEGVQKYPTMPYVEDIKAECNLSFLDGELEARLFFQYEDFKIPAAFESLEGDHLLKFVSKERVLARNLVTERKLIEELFQDFVFSAENHVFIAKSEKKIVEFMTEIVPNNKDKVTFNCPDNLLDLFLYDETNFDLQLKETDRMDQYELKLTVDGHLKDIRIDNLWDCVLSRRTYLELDSKKSVVVGESGYKIPKILVLDLKRIAAIVQLFDELGIEVLKNHTLQRPLWSVASIDKKIFDGLPIKFRITKRLQEIKSQMLGIKSLDFTPIPSTINATLRSYQNEGVHWMERMRLMYLNGILADDMGLGKTLQAIVAINQCRKKIKGTAMIVCPTSLLYNWKEEFNRFDPERKVLVIDGVPNQRKKMIDMVKKYDVVITSYSLMQKDVEKYCKTEFSYAILDEAQHIKNRTTRNAKSVKQLRAKYRLILSGTPIENSLEEMWSLFDFLMPGFLNTYERFVDKYMRTTGDEHIKNLHYLKKKVAPFILRRMKGDVLDDLPPVSEMVYHCQLSPVQSELYKSFADSARNELEKLVEREGFDKVQIHVLATLTRLKQICCHPAIFAKEKAEENDSAKYDMLIDLIHNLVESNHKTVIFSQYTNMLKIMRADFERLGISFVYLDGSTKNRLEIVNQFNEDKKISVFLVSLKAGGTGLNLVGADTVIHYDMWWNPAVENQATDRVHRMGQKKNVSVYKLVTLNTIEEKIVEMQKRKQGLVKKVVSTDDEVISKLTWEDVLELLQT